MQQKVSGKFGALIIRNDDIDELLEEIFRKYKFDTEFGIEDGVDYSENSNRGKKEKVM